MCRVDSQYAENLSGNAGCLIRVAGKMVVLTHRQSGKLDIPGGTADEGESAQCTAHRETFEETGFNVEVGQHLGTNERNFHFFACTLAGNFTGELQRFPVPDWSKSEVSAIMLRDPFVTTGKAWRFEDQLIPLRGMFNQVPESVPPVAD